VQWEIDTDLIEDWLLSLDENTYVQVRAALQVLSDDGPRLGRPLVDTVSSSRHKNMKELRPGSSGRSEVRILFAFDPNRHAIMLIAGDKAGKWDRWYAQAVPAADELLDTHLNDIKKSEKTNGEDIGRP